MSRRNAAMVLNADDRSQVRVSRRHQQDSQQALLGGLRAAMSTHEGRRGLGEFIESIGPLASVYDHSGSAMYYKEGRRSVAVELIATLEDADPHLYRLLKREIEAAREAAWREAGAVQRTRSPEDDTNG